LRQLKVKDSEVLSARAVIEERRGKHVVPRAGIEPALP
jgi:hypothetical protein